MVGGVSVDGLDRYRLGSRKARALLRELALARGQPVSVDRLVDALWESRPPAEPSAQLAVIVSRLRRVLGADRITLGDAGYRLHYDWMDFEAVEALVDDAERRLATGHFAAALSSANGAAAVMAGATDAADVMAQRLASRVRHLSIRALLASGDVAAAVENARRAIDADPLDEEAVRLGLASMAAAGQSAAALLLFESFRERMADELGASPSPATVLAHRAILRGESVPDVIVRAPPSMSRSRELRGLLAGRERETAELNEALRAARERGLTRLVVEGEPGIGKTFLVRHWITGLDSGVTVLAAECGQMPTSLPLQPVIDALHAHLRSLEPEAASRLLGRDASLLAPLFSGALGAEGPVAAPAEVLEVRTPMAEAMVHAALIGLTRRVCAAPSVLFIDDIHRADHATVAWINQLAQRGSDLLMLVLTTSRPRERRLLAVDRTITMTPLTVDSAAVIVGRERAAKLHRRTGGNPLFLSELAKSPDGDAIPDTVAAAIGARCDESPGAAPTLRAAAVLGVDVDLLATVCRSDPITIVDQLEQGVSLGFLEERRATFTFRHEIVREALAAGMTEPRRAALHREAARVMSRRRHADPLVTAEHARRSGEDGIAAEALTAASAIAAGRHDLGTALTLADEAVAFDANTAALLQRARVLLWLGRYDEAGRDADAAVTNRDDPRALEIAGAVAYYRRRFERSAALARSLLKQTNDDALRLAALVVGARATHASGDVRGALTLIEQAQSLAVATALPEPRSVHAFIHVHMGAADRALELLDGAQSAGASTGSASTAYTPVHEHFIRGYAQATCGRVSDALRSWSRGASEAERQGLVRYGSLRTNFTSWIYRSAGDMQRAREANEAARDGGRAVDYRELEVYAILDLCEIELLAAQFAEATVRLADARRLTADDYAYRWRHLLRIHLLDARIALRAGDAERAESLARDGVLAARGHAARRYQLMARLVELEAIAAQGGVVDAADVVSLCDELPRVAAPEAWALSAAVGARTGVHRCRESSRAQAAALSAALPATMRQTFERYAATVLESTSTSAARG